MSDIKEAHEKAHEAVRLILESEFFRENFYNVRESDADAMAERLLKTTYDSLEASGFVIVAEATENNKATTVSMKLAGGAVAKAGRLDSMESWSAFADRIYRAMQSHAARPRLTDGGTSSDVEG